MYDNNIRVNCAFANFFNDWVYNRPDAKWGSQMWDQWGVWLDNSGVHFKSGEDKLVFLMRWE